MECEAELSTFFEAHVEELVDGVVEKAAHDARELLLCICL